MARLTRDSLIAANPALSESEIIERIPVGGVSPNAVNSIANTREEAVWFLTYATGGSDQSNLEFASWAVNEWITAGGTTPSGAAAMCAVLDDYVSGGSSTLSDALTAWGTWAGEGDWAAGDNTREIGWIAPIRLSEYIRATHGGTPEQNEQAYQTQLLQAVQSFANIIKNRDGDTKKNKKPKK